MENYFCKDKEKAMKKIILLTACFSLFYYIQTAEAGKFNDAFQYGAGWEAGRISTNVAFCAVGNIVNCIFGGNNRGNSDYYGKGAFDNGDPYANAYQREMERLRMEEYYRQKRILEDRGRNDAYRDFYGVK